MTASEFIEEREAVFHQPASFGFGENRESCVLWVDLSEPDPGVWHRRYRRAVRRTSRIKWRQLKALFLSW